MKKHLQLLALLLCGFIYGTAQTTFQKTYGTSAYESGMGLRQTFDGGFIIVANQIDTNNNPSTSLVLIKTNSQGDTTWTKKYNWLNITANAIIQTSDSGYAITGSYQSNTFLFKTDINGDSLWLQSYPSSYPSNGNALIQTYTNQYVIAGDYEILTSVCCGAFSMTISPNGNLVNSAGLGSGRAYDVQLSSDSNYVVSYSTINFGPPYPHLIKFDAISGSIIWDRSYLYSSEMRFARTNDNGYILVGVYYSPPGGNVIIKVDSDGYLQWAKKFQALLYFKSIVELPLGGYYITGGGIIQSDLLLFKIDDAGDSLWTRFYGDTAADGGSQIINTNDSGFAIIGYTYSYGAGGSDVYFIKTDSVGTASIKEHLLIQNQLKIFPNPCVNNFTVMFTTPKNAIAKIYLVNVFGENVFEKSINAVAGDNNIAIHFNLDNGIYFLKMILDEKSFNAKLLVVK
jgi:hypothetical protein